MSNERGGCTHIAAVETVRQRAARVCDECITIGSSWVHLRTCQACGARGAATPRPIATPANTLAAAAIPSSHRLKKVNAGCTATRTM